jgi:ribonuclease HII
MNRKSIRPALDDMLIHERHHWAAGRQAIAGVDEAGRGPLAGPVVAAAVILPHRCRQLLPLQGLRDSKVLSPADREHFFRLICRLAVAYGLGIVLPPAIDGLNIHRATGLAMRRALACVPGADFALIDGPWRVPHLDLPHRPLVGGDDLSMSIAAAAVLAKVFRDRLMAALDPLFPAYGFAAHKGYGTAAHCRAILAHGLTPWHRRSFCRRLLEVPSP